ncbi:MAG: hypothetical protein HC941_13955 [Microcoleus sp. SU_5_3]|nr:hypothetical protein [Microcoleus sp. SU_5_3]
MSQWSKQGICSFPHPSAHLLHACAIAWSGGWNRHLMRLSSRRQGGYTA